MCIRTSYDQNFQLILKSCLPVVYGTPLSLSCLAVNNVRIYILSRYEIHKHLPVIQCKKKYETVRVTQFLVVYVCFVDRCLSSCTFSVDHCVVYSPSIYGFWLPLWYLPTLVAITSVPDLPLWLGVLKHMASLARGPHLPAPNIFYAGFLLMWCNFKFEGVLFRCVPDIMIEFITYWSGLNGIETKLQMY